MNVRMNNEYHEYATSLENQVQLIYEVAREARQKGLDPKPFPEIDIARDLAGLVEGLVGPPGVAESIRQLSKTMSREELASSPALVPETP